MLHHRIWCRKVSCHKLTDCNRMHWSPAVLANTRGRRVQDVRLYISRRACLLPCPTERTAAGPRPPCALALCCRASHVAAQQNQGSLAPGGDNPRPCSQQQHALTCTSAGCLLAEGEGSPALLQTLQVKTTKLRMSEFSYKPTHCLTGQK